jgi:hypothetical protein
VTLLPTISGLPDGRLLQRNLLFQDVDVARRTLEAGQYRGTPLCRERTARALEPRGLPGVTLDEGVGIRQRRATGAVTNSEQGGNGCRAAGLE